MRLNPFWTVSDRCRTVLHVFCDVFVVFVIIDFVVITVIVVEGASPRAPRRRKKLPVKAPPKIKVCETSLVRVWGRPAGRDGWRPAGCSAGRTSGLSSSSTVMGGAVSSTTQQKKSFDWGGTASIKSLYSSRLTSCESFGGNSASTFRSLRPWVRSHLYFRYASTRCVRAAGSCW